MDTMRRCAVLIVFVYLAGSFLMLLRRDGWSPPHRLGAGATSLVASDLVRSEKEEELAARPVYSPLDQLRRIHVAGADGRSDEVSHPR